MFKKIKDFLKQITKFWDFLIYNLAKILGFSLAKIWA